MRTTSLLRMAMGTGAVLLGLTIAPAVAANAAPPSSVVPCSSGATGLIAAVNAANARGARSTSQRVAPTPSLSPITARTAYR